MTERHRVCRLDELAEGEGREFVVADRVLAVYLLDGQVYALDGICPHAGGPLAQGMVRNQVVTCPWHGWQYNVCTGQHRINPKICVQTFAATVDDGVVYVNMP
uniref:Rieske (2Fe-2S) protein n=1 Tax=Schlesneria paludicola TaxID=360056 RepID=A0A7C2PGS8_9PLAN